MEYPLVRKLPTKVTGDPEIFIDGTLFNYCFDLRCEKGMVLRWMPESFADNGVFIYTEIINNITSYKWVQVRSPKTTTTLRFEMYSVYEWGNHFRRIPSSKILNTKFGATHIATFRKEGDFSNSNPSLYIYIPCIPVKSSTKKL